MQGAWGLKSNTRTMYVHLTQHKGMKDLVIIKGQNEDFVFIDSERETNGIIASYVPRSKWNGGDFKEDDIIQIPIDFEYQVSEIISGWEYPIFTDHKAYPDDDGFDFELAEEVALQVAHEMILQSFDKYQVIGL
ncbi:Uncharacterised protein [Sphingobacterium spiritivorum]|uniref:Uncharacterized protein n=2 Tax=Sphingobacterium spiritivorum TaxID=258 RepID=A0A380CDS5_SPHSI|nr:Uncharacterised protein [Sphingobacterium spiritivorum]